MEKTVLVIAANSLSGESCGHTITFDLSLGKTKGPSPTKAISKSVWTCCVESVMRYVRVTFDLFPDERQVCVAAVDYAKCQPINSWRDEDQELGKVLSGFQKFGQPTTHPPQQAPPPHSGHTPSHISPCLQGIQYGVRCLAQLTATQYAATTTPGRKPPTNQGRLILLCSLRNPPAIKELEKVLVSLVRAENSDIRQKQDPARLHISHCQMVVINSHTTPTSDIRDAPLTQLSSQASSIVYSFPAHLLMEKCLSLCKLHHDLKTTIITGIPMKEEQSGSGSANYDVELVHLAEAHRDILRGGYTLGPSLAVKKDAGKDSRDHMILKWSTPKTTSLDLQCCTSAYRVTPTNVTSRPTICLVNFVLSGKPVLLEQPRKGPQKLTTHILMSHAGSIYLHCIPPTRSHVDDPPSISEGWGGRITDYRISDFSQLVLDNMLFPHQMDRTKIPAVFPLHRAMAKLEKESQHWPLVYTDTPVYTLAQDLHPLPVVVRRDTMSERELEECKEVVMSLQSKESANEPLAVPNSGARSKGVKRDEQYRTLWSELESLTQTFSTNSEHHRMLAEFVSQATSHSPSMQTARKTPPLKSDGNAPAPAILSENTWQDPDHYQRPPEKELGEISGLGERSKDPRTWQHESGGGGGGARLPRHLPIPAQPVGSVLSLWTARQVSKASAGHTEFAGRMTFGPKAELYIGLRSNSSVVPPEQDS